MSDLISRQDAVNALENMSANYGAIGRREWHPHINECLEEIRYLPSARPGVRMIDYYDCILAMLRMWMDNVLTDREYNHIMDKLNAHWGMG